MMPLPLEGIVFSFSVLATLAMLVKYERNLKRWLLKPPRRRKRPKPALRVTVLP